VAVGSKTATANMRRHATGFRPASLDALNFLLADVRGALGPYLNVFLVTQQHWSQSAVGLVTAISGLLALRCRLRSARRSTRPAPNAP
jgi:hypothetical protein